MSAGVCREQKLEDGFRSPGARVAASCELPRVLVGPSSGHQREQSTPSIAEPYLQLCHIRTYWVHLGDRCRAASGNLEDLGGMC